ncbi:MAG TPA: hypothetical protein VG722_00560 [Tepidisphaeraceae bacterium]|nr:hypothetical protein [Tepidisphaeraceae bacterium]
MAAAKITFVFCVESGQLESMTLRSIQSLRRWGGGMAQSPVIAVKPRFGPPLDRQTLKRFSELGVRYLDVRPTRKYRWYHFLNKPSALLAANENATTELVAWMDSDVLFVGEPNDYLLSPEYDIAAYAPNGWIATSGPGDRNEPFWVAVCKSLSIDIDQLPYVQTEEDNRRVRLYWNAGIFAYRRETDYARAYRDYCVRLLDAHVAHREKKLFYHEQLAMALAGAKLRWRQMARSHNFTMEAWSGRTFAPEQLETARVIHYHDFAQAVNHERFVTILRQAFPDVADFLEQSGPIRGRTTRRNSWMRSGLHMIRGIQQRKHLWHCQSY